MIQLELGTPRMQARKHDGRASISTYPGSTRPRPHTRAAQETPPNGWIECGNYMLTDLPPMGVGMTYRADTVRR